MVREDTHLAGLRGDVDLDDALRLVDGLDGLRQLALSLSSSSSPPNSSSTAPCSIREHLDRWSDSYLGRKRQAEVNLFPYTRQHTISPKFEPVSSGEMLTLSDTASA